MFLSILGIGFLIFVHELGHFLAAKKVGIRVETFALGFQPTIAGWKARIFAMKRGDTEYVIGLLPFGGYVKMAGEELEDPRTGAADEYASKTPSQRALVLVAGAVMNLIFGFLLFILAFTMGVSFPSTQIGLVLGESPAWEAGMRAGDRVLTVAGKEKRDFTDLQTSIALSSRDTVLPVTYERTNPDGTIEVREAELRPRLNRERGMLEVGFATAGVPRFADVIGGGAAAEAGLRGGDHILAIALEGPTGRIELPTDWHSDAQTLALREFQTMVGEGAIELRVRENETAPERTVRIDLASIEPQGTPRLGITSGSAPRVRAIQPGSPLAEYFPIGATITSLAGEPVPSIGLWTVLSRTNPSDPTVTVGFSDGSEVLVPRDSLIAGVSNPGGGELILVGPAPVVKQTETGGLAAELGIVAGDILTAFDGKPISGKHALGARLEPGTVVTWRRDGEERSATVPEGGSRRALAVEIETPVVVAGVSPGSGAERAGIRVGDTVLSIEGETVDHPTDFSKRAADVVAKLDRDTPTPVTVVVERAGETMELAVTPAPTERLLGVRFAQDQVEIRTSIGGAIGEGWNQSVVWGRRIFLMIGSLIRRDVSAKNLAGPVGIVHIGKRVADEGFSKLIFVLAMISINLGIFNLLPFPILDGGHLFFLLIEKLKGSPVDENVQGYVHLIAFFILIGLAIFVTFHDITRLFG